MSDRRRIAAAFRSSRSDGNYGNESAEISLECFVDEEGDAELDSECAAVMLHQARALVEGELARSPSATVRNAFAPRPPAPPPSSSTAVTVPPDEEDLESLPF